MIPCCRRLERHLRSTSAGGSSNLHKITKEFVRSFMFTDFASFLFCMSTCAVTDEEGGVLVVATRTNCVVLLFPSAQVVRIYTTIVN